MQLTTNRRLVRAARGVFVASIFLIPLFVHAGVFSALAGLMAESKALAEEVPAAPNAQNVPLLRAVTADPSASRGGGDIIVDEDGALVPSLGPSGLTGTDVEHNGEISIHVVRPCTADHCETLSHIAEMYGVSVNTILWANEIKDPKTVQPGDELLILPVSGVRHVVKSGDTVQSVAKKYHADADAEELKAIIAEIMDYNRLASASDITPGATIVIPGGEVAAPTSPKGSGSAVAKVSGGTNISGYFSHPVPGAVRTQGIHGYNGVDLGAKTGTPVRASAGGQVIVSRASGWNGGYGNYIVVKHANGTQTLYAHLSSNAVATGASVGQGDVIGYVGNTGRSTGSHLHFEVRGAKNPF